MVFPARAGMSPAIRRAVKNGDRVPRASGDEPYVCLRSHNFGPVFPARAGMSPMSESKTLRGNGVPRASGDEPSSTASSQGVSECSPRERG